MDPFGNGVSAESQAQMRLSAASHSPSSVSILPLSAVPSKPQHSLDAPLPPAASLHPSRPAAFHPAEADAHSARAALPALPLAACSTCSSWKAPTSDSPFSGADAGRADAGRAVSRGSGGCQGGTSPACASPERIKGSSWAPSCEGCRMEGL